MMDKYCFYVRYFSHKTKKTQLNKMIHFILKNKINFQDIFYFEDYAKGSTQNREGLNKIIELAYHGEFNQLVILIPHIIHIDYVEYTKIEDDLLRYGVNIIKLVGADYN